MSPYGIGYKQTWYPPDVEIVTRNFYKIILVYYI